MDMHNLVQELESKKVKILPLDALDDLLKSTSIVFEKDTLISDLIRILQFEEYFITQEISTKKEAVLRLFHSKQEAEDLVNDHLKTYDMMWDGCGCKVNYYS
jgi:hypothetical protein